mmetsp:Transcript_28212/g.83534  ORF Transcript_28212/g.83534 Transcript_28212/m.83534 type:complete len:317 (+) Transcript_28212:4847-5797(+)
MCAAVVELQPVDARVVVDRRKRGVVGRREVGDAHRLQVDEVGEARHERLVGRERRPSDLALLRDDADERGVQVLGAAHAEDGVAAIHDLCQFARVVHDAHRLVVEDELLCAIRVPLNLRKLARFQIAQQHCVLRARDEVAVAVDVDSVNLPAIERLEDDALARLELLDDHRRLGYVRKFKFALVLVPPHARVVHVHRARHRPHHELAAVGLPRQRRHIVKVVDLLAAELFPRLPRRVEREDEELVVGPKHSGVATGVKRARAEAAHRVVAAVIKDLHLAAQVVVKHDAVVLAGGRHRVAPAKRVRYARVAAQLRVT